MDVCQALSCIQVGAVGFFHLSIMLFLIIGLVIGLKGIVTKVIQIIELVMFIVHKLVGVRDLGIVRLVFIGKSFVILSEVKLFSRIGLVGLVAVPGLLWSCPSLGLEVLTKKEVKDLLHFGRLGVIAKLRHDKLSLF